jgi:hypothetical protein
MHGGSLLKYLTNDWKFDDSFQMQTGLPFSATVSGKHTSGILSDWNGNGSVTFIPQVGQNNYFQPEVVVDDIRLEKDFLFNDRYNVQLMGQAFNIANHQNVTEVYNEAYSISGTTATYQASFGQTELTNNSGFSYTPREVEISMRLSW